MKTLLVNLPWRVTRGRYGVRAGSRWPFTIELEHGRKHYLPFPFFLAYAASLLKKHNKDTYLFDAIAEGADDDACIEKVNSYRPTLIVAETSTPSFYSDMHILQRIKEVFPSCKIAVCGPHTSVFPYEILSEYNFVEYVFVGEYEYTLLEFVDCLEKTGDFTSIRGLGYREDRKVNINPYRGTTENLDTFPWPEREDVPIYNYNDGFCDLPVPNVQIWASRGCPFKCTFCLWPQVMYREHKYRKRDVTDVVDEMEYLVNKYNFKAVYFDDDVFNIDKKYVISICKEIKKRNIHLPWACMARGDLMDEELLENMKEAGLYAIKYGIESADKDILKFCNKNIDLDKSRSIITYTKEIGVKVHLTFCVGFPQESKETLKTTVNFIKDTKPHSYQLSFVTPFPGTELYNYLKENGMLTSSNWSDYDGNCKCVVNVQKLGRDGLIEARYALSNIYRSAE